MCRQIHYIGGAPFFIPLKQFHTIHITLSDDIKKLLIGLKNVLSGDGKMYFTTLVNSNRAADRYLKALSNAGKLVSRNMDQLHAVFDQVGMSIQYNISGNMAFIYSWRK
jgi:hypothetical protein